jgi:hypothetical protein
MATNTKNYLVNVAAAITGRDGFQMTSTEVTASMTVLVLAFLYMVLYAYGAASLSYNYNLYVGNTGGIVWVYTILSFIFSSLYYPFYAVFLSPALGRAPNAGNAANMANVSQQGGKARRR